MLSPNNSITFSHTLVNPITGLNVNNATVTIDIQDSNGVSIAETTPPAQLFFVSDGLYRQTFASLSVIPKEMYTIIVEAVTPEPLYLTCKKMTKATDRIC